LFFGFYEGISQGGQIPWPCDKYSPAPASPSADHRSTLNVRQRSVFARRLINRVQRKCEGVVRKSMDFSATFADQRNVWKSTTRDRKWRHVSRQLNTSCQRRRLFCSTTPAKINKSMRAIDVIDHGWRRRRIRVQNKQTPHPCSEYSQANWCRAAWINKLNYKGTKLKPCMRHLFLQLTTGLQSPIKLQPHPPPPPPRISSADSLRKLMAAW